MLQSKFALHDGVLHSPANLPRRSMHALDAARRLQVPEPDVDGPQRDMLVQHVHHWIPGKQCEVFGRHLPAHHHPLLHGQYVKGPMSARLV
jgi:hypothetical protein